MIETWKDIPGHEGRYQASDKGRIRSLSRTIHRGIGKHTAKAWTYGGRMLQAGIRPSGHLAVRLGRSSGLQAVHRLVLHAFYGECPQGMEACHNNGNPSDNRLENLRWASRLDNVEDRRKHYGGYAGENNPSSKLTADQVLEIVRMRKDGILAKEVAEKFGVTPDTVYTIAAGRQWGSVTGIRRTA